MAEATSLLTVTPKLLGKHLRDVRRKKGLSLSEVARGAGLSRRELVAYERGKVPIPESDLWVLAGSCGVDVSELMPRTSAPELAAGAASTTVGDTVAQLRRNQDDAALTPYLASLHRLKELPPGKKVPVKDRELQAIADALGREPMAMEQRLQKVMKVSPEEASRLRELILPPIQPRRAVKALEAPAPAIPAPVMPMPVAPPAFLDTPLDTPIDTSVGHNVDVFEELARLPEPLPLGDPTGPVPDLLAPPPPPDGTVELVDGMPQPVNAGAFGVATPAPVLVDSAAAVWNAADAPPIDVAQRQGGSSTWDLGEAPAAPLPARSTDPGSWDSAPWQPPTPPGSDASGPPSFWEGTDDWTPIAPESSLVAPETDAWTPTDAWATPDAWTIAEPATGEPPGAADAADVTDTWTPTGWEAAKWGADPWAASPDAEPVVVDPDDPWTANEWPQELVAEVGVAETAVVDTACADTGTELVDGPVDPGNATGPWDHQPDPAAVSSGFYVDWGTPETEAQIEPATPEPWEARVGADPSDAFAAPVEEAPFPPIVPSWEPEPVEGLETAETNEAYQAYESTWEPEPVETLEVEPSATVETFESSWEPEPVETVETAETPETPEDIEAVERGEDEDDAPPMIMWRADGSTPAVDAGLVSEPQNELEALLFPPQPEPVEFVTAGEDWQLGNALPLVEVRGKGALVMRRADERWALADVNTLSDFIAEVEVDFRSGPGLGVLFRASVDEAGRMSGYSFDIDPIYDGGGYLVRQWQADRELWNPIARVSSGDPTTMYGSLTVRLVVVDDHLTALVNGVEVLTVDSLEQASVDRGREAATGDRVGVQAWSSSDLVIDTLRVA
jgi:transcriptional regulator with XRE-family HTH domain